MRTSLKPFPEDPSRVLHFESGLGRRKPAIRRPWLANIEVRGLDVTVAQTANFTRKEAIVLGMKGLGANLRLIHDTTGISRFPLYSAYTKLGISATERAGEQAIRLAFKRGIFLADPDAGEKVQNLLQPLRPSAQERFFSTGSLLGEGLTNGEIGDVLSIAGPTVANMLTGIHKILYINTATHVLVAGALGMFPNDEEPASVMPEEA